MVTAADDAPWTDETDTDDARSTDEPVQRPVARINVPAAMSMAAAAALLIAMGEINRLSGAVPDLQGRSWPFDVLMGPSQLLNPSADGWIAGTGTYTGDLTGWLRVYCLLDAGFALLYTLGLRSWFEQRCRPAALLVVPLGIIDGAEDLAAFIVGRPTAAAEHPSLLQAVLPWITFAKFTFVALIVLALVRRFLYRPERRPREGRTPQTAHWPTQTRTLLRALFTQRFSVLPLLPLLFLSLIPGPDMSDQLPDVQRRWTDGSPGTAHAFLALAFLVLLAAAVFVLGRFRSDLTYRLAITWKPTDRNPDAAKARPAPVVWLWLVGPLVVAVVGVALPSITDTDGLSVVRMLRFVAIPIGIGAASWALSRLWAADPERLNARRKRIRAQMARGGRVLEEGHIDPVVKTGDALAALALSVGGLGLIRSFTAVVAIGSPPDTGLARLMLVGGAVLAIGAWPAAAWVMHHLPAGPISVLLTPGQGDPESTLAKGIRVALLALFAAGYLVLGMVPLSAANGLGVIASVTLAMTLLTGIVAAIVILLQYGGAPYVFWFPWTRLRAAPVVSLLVVTVLWASSAGGESSVHGIRGQSSGTQVPPSSGAAAAGPSSANASSLTPTTTRTRTTLADAFDGWLKDPDACGTPFTAGGHEYMLRPLVLVAAEGGGIRAAYWSVAALQLIGGYSLDSSGNWTPPEPVAEPADGKPLTEKQRRASQGCGAHSVLFSSGASGGAVGLTVNRFANTTPTSDQPPAVTAVEAMADHQALGAGAIGLLVRDLVYASSGVPLPVLDSLDGTSAQATQASSTSGAEATTRRPWLDRAALMEVAWEKAAPGLSAPTRPADHPTTTGTTSGHLVFGSTSMTTGCRMLVSQLDVSSPQPSPSSPQSEPGGPPAAGDAPVNGTCDELARPAPSSVDLFADYDAGRGTTTQHGCLGDVPASTAAMLAARFPYVTPSGVIGPCGRGPTQQLVDGGYTENTGIGTVVDLGRRWLPMVQQQNASALAAALKPAQPATTATTTNLPQIVVPLVVYLDNGTGSDLMAPTRKVTNELLVPPVGKSRAQLAQYNAPALLQRAGTLASTDAMWGPSGATTDVVSAVSLVRPPPVVVVDQSTFPAVTAPLGWVLSQSSITTMKTALAEQATSLCDANRAQRDALCANGFGTLADAISKLGGGKE
jgi:hypothetical protein